MNDPNINDNMIKGFNQFLECFDDFLDNILEVKNIKECDIIIYGTATLENGSIIRAKNKFHDKPWFSNVAISMDSNESSDYQSDEGLCYVSRPGLRFPWEFWGFTIITSPGRNACFDRGYTKFRPP
ncbi:hypothetical protein Glove_349g2 [Diversispora epigaea]|uniref:Uncharacterized protein n=1 Tax=Diversispora epigaea TaxID=1348612 RepID=A0A397HI64_9GLOM|nr:hypothetical protein Glove_349g2 [Diversispora epigaea]